MSFIVNRVLSRYSTEGMPTSWWLPGRAARLNRAAGERKGSCCD